MTDADRYYAALDAINVDSWAHLAHMHIADDGPTGVLARALATAIQIAEQALEDRQIMPSTCAATPKVADFPKPLEPWS